ncbi:hypothetical protein BSY240_4623 (plasmid) [Agrobacterium sp. RAC06]|nr:hypothetical protein BSY240_4623 [Agrobacterium sp. RAC06]
MEVLCFTESKNIGTRQLCVYPADQMTGIHTVD